MNDSRNRLQVGEHGLVGALPDPTELTRDEKAIVAESFRRMERFERDLKVKLDRRYKLNVVSEDGTEILRRTMNPARAHGYAKKEGGVVWCISERGPGWDHPV